MQIANFEQAKQVLRAYIPAPLTKPRPYSLDRMQQMMELLGNPQNQVKVIHVAGTSGKSSTCYYIAGALKAADFTVALTVSPHVAEVNERVQINLQPLSEAEFCSSLGVFIDLIEKSGIRPSYFELLAAFAYHEFAKRKVDYAVVETGLGGLLDGTNVVTREDKVCVITDIGFDHTEVLGDTLPEIATQKAGIIQPRNTVFTHQQDPSIIAVFSEVVTQQSADLRVVTPAETGEVSGLPLFQQHNWQLAEQAVNFVLARDHSRTLTKQEVSEAQQTVIPARMEIMQRNDKTIVLDGAHNEQKLRLLVASIRDKFPDQEIAVLLSLSKGYQLQEVIKLITGLAHHIIVTEFSAAQDSPKRPVPGSDIVDACRAIGFESVEFVAEPIKALAVLRKRSEPVLVVTGSFYLLYEIRPELLS